MAQTKTLAEWMQERGKSVSDLVEGARVDKKVVEAIAQGRYTPSPEQRQRLAAALEVSLDQIQWGHRHGVEHLYGHGTQFGRSP